MKAASTRLGGVLPGPVEHVEGPQSDLKHWHAMFAPLNPFGLLLVNTTGGPEMFSIAGGPGRPGDVPRGVFTAVSMIHSFSAANPSDPQTLAGRWLANGAYVYFGSVQEPFLPAFRTPGLVAELIAADMPLVAALRQGEGEPGGFPWRLVYLGDPLYRAGPAPREKTDVTATGQKDASKGPQATASQWGWWSGTSRQATPPENHEEDRIDVDHWAKAAAPHDVLPVVAILAMDAKPGPAVSVREDGHDAEKLQLCIDAAIAEAAAESAINHKTTGPTTSGRPNNEWRSLLQQVRRERLDEAMRSTYDELLIDALEQVGAIEELQLRLAKIPPEEAGARVWQAQECSRLLRLARLPQDRTSEPFDRALRLWDEMMSLSWPKGSRFPGQLTERVAAMTGIDPGRRLPAWQEQLQKTAGRLEAQGDRFPHVRAITAEQARVEAQRTRR